MPNKNTDNIASCSECPSTFKLVPPADIRYKYPREKSTVEDCIKRVYECEDESHRNTIYWEPDTGKIFFAGKDPR